MSRLTVRKSVACFLAALGAVLVFSVAAQAQDNSGGSDTQTLSGSSSESGFDSSFNGDASTLGSDLQGGVSDQGGSQAGDMSVDGRVSADAVDGYAISAYTQANADQLAGASMGGGRRSDAAAAGSGFSTAGSSLAVSGFGDQQNRLAFSGGQTLAAMATERSRLRGGSQDQRESLAQVLAVDPVLTANMGTYGEPGLELGVAPPLPSAVIQTTFASPPYSRPQYQFDDGQTPYLFSTPEPGALLSTMYGATAVPNGFPDSTLGQAGLPSMAQAFGEPAGLSFRYGTASSPFPSTTDLFAPAYGLHPTLITHLPQHTRYQDYLAYEHYMFQQRILLGMNVSAAEALRRADQETYERQRESTLSHGFGTFDQAPSGMPQIPVIH